MGFNDEKWIRLDAALNNAFSEFNELKSLVERALGVNPNNVIPRDAYFKDAVEYIIKEADQMSRLPKLVAVALELSPTNQMLNAFVNDFPDFDSNRVQPAPADIYSAYRLHAGLLFFGRQKLREKLRLLREDDYASQIFLIRGKRKTGKTYSKEFINYLNENKLPFRSEKHKMIYVDLDTYTHQPYDIAVSIGKRINADVSSAPLPQQEDVVDKERIARYIHRLCDWLHGEIVRLPNSVWWFVFDGFRLKELLPETKDMINAFALRIHDELPQCRLVLVNYSDIISVPKPHVEEVQLPERADLINFFRNYTKDNKLEVSEDLLETIADRIIAEVDAETPKTTEQWLPKLNEATDLAVQKLFA